MKQRTRHNRYSTSSFSIILNIIIYTGIFLIFDRVAASMPNWLWFAGLPVLVSGIMLQFLSTRLLWIQAYQTITFFFAGLVHSFAFWLILRDMQNLLSTQLTCLIVVVVFVVCTVGSYYTTKKRAREELLGVPYGIVGTISQDTGLLMTEIISESFEKREFVYVENLNHFSFR